MFNNKKMAHKETVQTSKFNKFVVFKYDDSIEFKVPFEHAKISDLVNDLLNEHFDNNDEIQEEILPLTEDKVKSSIFPKIIEYMVHYSNEPMNDFKTPIESFNISELVQEYYVNYLYGSSFDQITEENVRELRELIMASNFLGIQPLLKFTLVKMGILTEKNSEIILKAFPKRCEE